MSKRPKRRLLVPWMFVLTSSVVISILENPIHATYKIENGIAASATVDVRSAVCYYTFSGSKYYFGKIEDGLAAAAKTTSNAITVFVIPGNTVEIKKDCEIASNVTLTLPYEGDSYLNGNFSTSATWFANDSDHRSSYQKLQVILKSKLTINGTLNIGGSLGNGSSPNSQGQTTGPYAELIMARNSSIQCSGTINCYGYIREDYGDANDSIKGDEERAGNGSYIDVKSGATVREPLVIYDFRGGNATSSLQKSIFPMNLFDFPQIAPKMIFASGAHLIGRANIYAKWVGNTPVEATIIGTTSSSGLINSADDNTGYLTFKNTDTSSGTYITNFRGNWKNHHLDLDFNGHYHFGSLKLNVSGISADSSNYFMPMSNIFHLQLESGSVFDVNNRVKFLPGSSVEVKKGATGNLNADVVFHSYTSNGSTNPSTTYWGMPNDYPEAVLQNNGVLNIGTHGTKASFGGKIVASQSGTSADTKIVTGTDGYFGNSVATIEIKPNNTLSDTDTFTYPAIADLAEKPGTDVSNSIEKNQTLWPSDTFAFKQNNNQETYWTYNGIDKPVVSISANASDGETKSISNDSSDTSFELTLSASSSPFYFSADEMSYSWSLAKAGAVASTATGSNVTFPLAYPGSPSDNNRSDQTTDYTITLNWSYKHEKEGELTGSKQFSLTLVRKSCLLPGTLITMADGSKKPIENVHGGDMVLVFNHGTGRYDVAPVMFNDPEPINQVKVIHCEFDDGTTLGIIDEHGLFDMDLNQYVYITEETMSNYVGHHFFSNQNSLDFNQHRIVTLKRVYIQEEMTACYSITTAKHFNYFTNGLLGLGGGIAGMFNYFDLDADMKVDLVKMKRDIEKYGLFAYDDFKAYLTEEEFNAYNGKYLKVALGKGLLTKRKLEQLIARYGGKAT